MFQNKLLKMLLVVFFVQLVVACTSNKPKESAMTNTDDAMSATTSGAGMDSGVDESNLPKMTFADLTKTFYFGFDRSVLTSETRFGLDQVAAFLKMNSLKIRIEGHTDERGSRQYNMALGERRGLSVKDYLVAKGISPSRLEVISYGEEKPAVRASNSTAYAKNRRVEIKLQ